MLFVDLSYDFHQWTCWMIRLVDLFLRILLHLFSDELFLYCRVHSFLCCRSYGKISLANYSTHSLAFLSFWSLCSCAALVTFPYFWKGTSGTWCFETSEFLNLRGLKDWKWYTVIFSTMEVKDGRRKGQRLVPTIWFANISGVLVWIMRSLFPQDNAMRPNRCVDRA